MNLPGITYSRGSGGLFCGVCAGDKRVVYLRRVFTVVVLVSGYDGPGTQMTADKENPPLQLLQRRTNPALTKKTKKQKKQKKVLDG